MNNTYHELAVQLRKLEQSKKASLFNLTVPTDKFDSEAFFHCYQTLKERYCAVHLLMGEENFKELTWLFLQTNPLQSSAKEKYGHNFSDFLASLAEIQNFYFIRFIAMLDWFWYSSHSPKQRIQLPKGTLKSWGNILRGEDQLDIELDELELEVLSIQKNGKEYKIIQH